MAVSRAAMLLAAAAVLAGLLPAAQGASRWKPKGFIRVQGGAFVDENCEEYLLTGWNSWNRPMLDYAIKAIDDSSSSEAKALEDQFAKAADAGFNTMRVFLSGIDQGQATQTTDGGHVESTWAGFDYILDLCSQYGIKVIFVWVNNWQQWEGPGWYLDPNNPTGVNLDSFWSDQAARTRLYEHMYWVVNRVNTVNGRTWKNDPAILAWNLFNELRCPADQRQDQNALSACRAAVQTWIEETSNFLKIADPNHLVTFGQEGFFGQDSPLVDNNPGGVPGNVQAGWAGWVGQDFKSQHEPSGIDFLSFHMWADNWQTFDLGWVEQWINSHVQVAQDLGKPLLLQEFGKRSDKTRAPEMRDPYYNTVYRLVEDQASSNGILKGSLFWYWDPFNDVFNKATPDTPEPEMPPSACVIHTDGSDASTWDIIVSHSQKLHGMQQRKVGGCSAGVSASSVGN